MVPKDSSPAPFHCDRFSGFGVTPIGLRVEGEIAGIGAGASISLATVWGRPQKSARLSGREQRPSFLPGKAAPIQFPRSHGQHLIPH